MEEMAKEITKELPKLHAALIGGLGAIISYMIVFYRRFKEFLKLPEIDLKKRAFDILLIMFIGGVWTAFAIEPVSSKQAFLSGLMAETAIGKILMGKL